MAEEQSNINSLDIVKSLEITSAYVDKLASAQQMGFTGTVCE
jgi:hypothetical protein